MNGEGLGRYGLVALILGGASAVVFAPALVLPSALFFRDILHYYWQSHQAVVEAIRVGSMPQWNAAPFMGVPLLGDVHAGSIYPLNLLYLVLSYPRAYAWLLWIHHVVGGAGLFALVRQLTQRTLAGLTAAICFMLSGYIVSLHCAGALMAGAAYVPWLLLVLNSDIRAIKKVVTVSALVALQALTGDPQSVLFSALAAAGLEICKGPRWDRTLVLAGGFSLAGALAAVQLIPAWQAFRESTRGAPGAELVMDWATHPLRLAELFLPFPFGGYLETPQFWPWFIVHGPASTPLALSLYFGASSLLLGLLGIGRKPSTKLGLFLLGVGILLAIGPSVGVGAFLQRIPPFRFFRYPEKYMFLATLGWSILVGLGTARVEEAGPLPKSRLRSAMVIWTGIAVGLAASFLWRSSFWAWSRALLERARTPVDPSGPLESVQVSIGTALILVALSAAAIYLARRRPELIGGRVLLVVIISIDLVLAARRIVWFEDADLYSHRPEIIAAMEQQAPSRPWRYLRHSPALRAIVPYSSTLDQLIATRAWELMTLKSNLGGVFGLEEVSGYGAVELTRTMAVFSNIGGDPVRIAQLGAACFILTASGTAVAKDPRVEAIQEWPPLGVTLLKLRQCLPRIHAVMRTVQVEGASAAALALRSNDFSLSTTAVVENEPAASFDPVVVESVEVQPQSATARVRAAPGGGFLVFATSYYPGWTVRVDDRAARLVKANLATMGVWVPEGDHRVQFKFTDPGLYPGIAVSLLGVAVWISLLGQSRKRAGRSEGDLTAARACVGEVGRSPHQRARVRQE